MLIDLEMNKKMHPTVALFKLKVVYKNKSSSNFKNKR